MTKNVEKLCSMLQYIIIYRSVLTGWLGSRTHPGYPKILFMPQSLFLIVTWVACLLVCTTYTHPDPVSVHPWFRTMMCFAVFERVTYYYDGSVTTINTSLARECINTFINYECYTSPIMTLRTNLEITYTRLLLNYRYTLCVCSPNSWNCEISHAVAECVNSAM